MYSSDCSWGNLRSPWISADLSVWSALIDGRKPVEYQAGEHIYWCGKPFDHIFIVAKGRVCISVNSAHGEHKQLCIACPGAMFGEIDCILGVPRSTDAVAIKKSEIYRIPSKEAQHWFHSNQDISEKLLQYVAHENQILLEQIILRCFSTARERVIKMLCYLADAYGQENGDGSIFLNIRFTCEELSAIIGTSRVTANLILRDLAEEGFIRKNKGRYSILRMEDLRGAVETF